MRLYNTATASICWHVAVSMTKGQASHIIELLTEKAGLTNDWFLRLYSARHSMLTPGKSNQ